MIITGLGLDMLMYRNAFNYAPYKTFLGNHSLTGADFLHRPDLAVWNMMQGVDYICHTSLADIIEADRVIRTIPAP